jgi:hypothetical protein
MVASISDLNLFLSCFCDFDLLVPFPMWTRYNVEWLLAVVQSGGETC